MRRYDHTVSAVGPVVQLCLMGPEAVIGISSSLANHSTSVRLRRCQLLRALQPAICATAAHMYSYTPSAACLASMRRSALVAAFPLPTALSWVKKHIPYHREPQNETSSHQTKFLPRCRRDVICAPAGSSDRRSPCHSPSPRTSKRPV